MDGLPPLAQERADLVQRQLLGAVAHCLGTQVRRQVVVPPPRMVLEESARHADLVGHRMQLLEVFGEQVAELVESQAGARIVPHGVDVASHGTDDLTSEREWHVPDAARAVACQASPMEPTGAPRVSRLPFRLGWLSRIALLVSVAALCGCSVTTAGHGHAVSATPARSAAPASSTASSGGEPWVATVDPETGIRFALPGVAREQTQTDVVDGKRIEKRIYLVEMSDEVGVAATVANGATETVVFGDLDSIPVELVAQFRGAGSTDIAVLERRHVQVQGHSALDFRISFTPLDHTKGKSMWFVRAIDDDTSLVMLQTIAFPPLGVTGYEAKARALQAELVASLTLK